MYGPIALIDTDTLVVALATQRELYEKINSNIVEVKTRGASTLVISQGDTSIFKDSADTVITIPETEDIFASILSIIPAQLFAYYCSVLKGNNPDQRARECPGMNKGRLWSFEEIEKNKHAYVANKPLKKEEVLELIREQEEEKSE